MNWSYKYIGDICRVGDGAHASLKRQSKGIMYLTSKNFKPDGIDLSKVDYISKDLFLKHFRKDSKAITLPLPNDILLSIIGSLGAVYIMKDDDSFGLSSSVSILRPNMNLISPYYLYYWIKSSEFQSSIIQIKSGVAQGFLSLSMIRSLPVSFPNEIITQLKIASILSVYDDLIENNLKRIKLLEEAAQNIYKEWFVNFRFPGHENARFITHEDGSKLPEGWEKKPLAQFIDFKEGPGLRNWQYREDGVPFLNIRLLKNNDIDFKDIKYLDEAEVELKYQHFLLNHFDHVISTSGTLGRVVTIRKSHLPLCLNTSIIRMRPKSDQLGKWLIKRIIKSHEFLSELESFATGSAQLNFGPKHLNMMKLIIPTKEISIKFEQTTDPVEMEIFGLLESNNYLEEARDILLPRLMNRTIEV